MDVKEIEERRIFLRYRGIEGDTIHFWVAILAYKRESLFFFPSRLRDTESSAANSSCRINGTRSSTLAHSYFLCYRAISLPPPSLFSFIEEIPRERSF